MLSSTGKVSSDYVITLCRPYQPFLQAPVLHLQADRDPTTQGHGRPDKVLEPQDDRVVCILAY